MKELQKEYCNKHNLRHGKKYASCPIKEPRKDWEKEFDDKFTERRRLRFVDKRLKSGKFKYKYPEHTRWKEKWDGGDGVNSIWITPEIIKSFISNLLSSQQEKFMNKHDKHTEYHIGLREKAVKKARQSTIQEIVKMIEKEKLNIRHFNQPFLVFDCLVEKLNQKKVV